MCQGVDIHHALPTMAVCDSPSRLVGLVVLLGVVGAVAGFGEGLPAGYTTYFRSQTCPSGWSPLPEAAGRLLVSVGDASIAGLTVGTPLADKEDRTHSHSFDATATLPSKHVAAVGCCNDQAAKAGSITQVNGTSDAATSGLPFTQIVLCRLDQADPAALVPFGTVAYFDSTVPECPGIWQPYNASVGRTLVPGYRAEQGMTRSKSPPLASEQKPTHKHTFTGSMTTDPVSFAGVDGCCNDSPAGSGTYSTDGAAAEADSNLPYMQLLTCMSMYQTFNCSLPADALMFNPLIGCPKGWQLASELSGRFLVPVPAGGTVGASFGGTSLTDGHNQEPTHTHNVEGAIPAPSAGVGLASGCCASGYAKAENIPFTATTSGDVVAFPWLMLSLCEQV